MPLDGREASQLSALDHLLEGNWVAAAGALDFHNMHYPRDLVALQAGHLMDFYRGSARDLRDRIARALPHWNEDVPGYHAVLGMHAFGLEEAGDYAKAEEAGRRAIDLEPLDSWAHHAVTHVMEMQGRAEDGIGWMIAREPYWTGEDNFFKVHNWWHRALFHLDLGQVDRVLALYDGHIRATAAGSRSISWTPRRCCGALPGWPRRGRPVGGGGRLLGRSRRRPPLPVQRPARDHGLPGRRADDRGRATARRDAPKPPVRGRHRAVDRRRRPSPRDGVRGVLGGAYREAVEALHPVRFIANQFGGSHAQRDVIDWTLTEAAIRANLPGVAVALAGERSALKPHSPVNRDFVRRAGTLATA